jgi:hypothetical protein
MDQLLEPAYDLFDADNIVQLSINLLAIFCAIYLVIGLLMIIVTDYIDNGHLVWGRFNKASGSVFGFLMSTFLISIVIYLFQLLFDGLL